MICTYIIVSQQLKGHKITYIKINLDIYIKNIIFLNRITFTRLKIKEKYYKSICQKKAHVCI